MFLKHAKFPDSVADEQDPLKRAKAGSMGRTEMNAFAKATNGSGTLRVHLSRPCGDGKPSSVRDR